MDARAIRSIVVSLLTLGISGAFAQVPETGLQPGSPVANIEKTAVPDPEDMTSSHLVVLWHDGRLSVTAHRTSLHSVLAAIAKQTGLVIEVSGGTDLGTVYVDLGPGTMHDVLSSLLDGDPNNYILVGSASRPGFVERLVLSKADHTRVVATNEVPAPPLQPQLYGAGFSTTPPTAPNEPAPVADAQTPEINTALPPVQTTIDSTIQRYQQSYSDMMKSGKSRADILNELQQQQIRDLDAQAAQPPQ